MVIQSRNPVYSVLFLILVFFNAAGLLLLLGLDFFAMIFLVVYVGAIAVLFLFVVMMLNIKLAELNEKKLRYLPVGGFLGCIFLFEIFLIVDNDCIPLISASDFGMSSQKWGLSDKVEMATNGLVVSPSVGQIESQLNFTEWGHLVDTLSNISALGLLLYTYYFYYFLVAGLILLVAMIGAILLTLHKGVSAKRQHVFQQNTRQFDKTIGKVA